MKERNPGPPRSDERYYTVAEVAARYKVDKRTVRNWIRRGWLRAIKKGRVVRVAQSALDAFDASH